MAELDPKTRTLLDLMAALGEPPLAEQTIGEFRARRERGRDLVNIPGPDLPVLRDVEVAGADGTLRARIYDVEDGTGRPTLVFFHGGGFVYASIESHDPVCRKLAAAGRMRVVSVEYRLAPEHPFPAAPMDAIAAVADIARAGNACGADSARIAVGGDSAGGCLAAVVARHFARTRTADIAFQLLIYPVVQTGATKSRERYASGYFLTQEGIDMFNALYVPPGTDLSDERLAPLAVPPPKGLAPARVVTAGFDPLLDEGRAYAKALAAAGIGVDYAEYPDQIHGFFNFTKFSNVAEQAIADSGLATRRALDAARKSFAP